MEGEEPTEVTAEEGNVENLGAAEDVGGSRKPEQKANTRQITLLSMMTTALVVILAWAITMTVLYANNNNEEQNQQSFEMP
jgi:Ca2+/H+ antiporter